MGKLASAGIRVGTALMPVIPFAGDDEESLDTLVRATKDNGGSFVLAGGLSMAGTQALYTLEAASQMDPLLSTRIKDFYQLKEDGKISYSPPRSYSIRLGRTVRRLCAKHGIPDRLERFIADNMLAVNKWVAEKLFLKTYDMELENANPYQIWAYRKAAWMVDDLEENLANLYHAGGEARLQELPGIGKGISSQMAGWIRIFEQQTSWKKRIH